MFKMLSASCRYPGWTSGGISSGTCWVLVKIIIDAAFYIANLHEALTST